MRSHFVSVKPMVVTTFFSAHLNVWLWRKGGSRWDLEAGRDGPDDASEVVEDGGEVPVLEAPDVEDDVDFLRPVAHRRLSLEPLREGRMG